MALPFFAQEEEKTQESPAAPAPPAAAAAIEEADLIGLVEEKLRAVLYAGHFDVVSGRVDPQEDHY